LKPGFTVSRSSSTTAPLSRITLSRNYAVTSSASGFVAAAMVEWAGKRRKFSLAERSRNEAPDDLWFSSATPDHPVRSCNSNPERHRDAEETTALQPKIETSQRHDRE